MRNRTPDPRELGYYFALAQVGLEMVFPLGVGLVLDHYLNWSPWATVVGAVVGFVGGLFHLVIMVSRHDAEKRRKGEGEGP